MSNNQSDRMATWVERLLTALIWLNWIAGAAIATFLVATMILADQLIGNADTEGLTAENIGAVRSAMLIGIVTVPFAHLALSRLRAIVATVRDGDPFVAANAERLTSIAWALLAIMVCDLGFGFISMMTEPEMGWSFSLTGWLAVLLLFVLARVFNHGARLREDMEGTV